MIYRADLSSINYIVSSKNSCIHEKMHESKKEGSSYILIDYFDWLTYVSRSNDLVKIDNAFQFKYYFNKCENLIKVLNSRLNSDNMLYIASLLQKERVLEGEESLSILDLLCRGYLLFEKEMWDLQIFLLERYSYNNTTIPLLIVPFSFGLNRLSTGHVNIIEKRVGNVVETDYQVGVIEDDCVRSKIDFGIRTCTLHKLCDEPPYSLPEIWQVGKVTNKYSALIHSKMSIVTQCYSQYLHSGLLKDCGNTEFEKALLSASQPTAYIDSPPTYSSLFLLNFPFLLEGMQLTPTNVNGREINKVSFLEKPQ